MSDIDELLAKGRAALEDAGDPDEVVARVEQFAAAFQRWLDSCGPDDSQRQAALAKLERASLEQLMVVHREVLARAEVLQTDTSEALRLLKQRGKGILAYTGVLPSRVSIGRTRKG